MATKCTKTTITESCIEQNLSYLQAIYVQNISTRENQYCIFAWALEWKTCETKQFRFWTHWIFKPDFSLTFYSGWGVLSNTRGLHIMNTVN